MKKLFLLLALLGMVAVGCSKDDTDKGNDNKTEQPNENEGGNKDNIPENIFFGLDKESVTISPDGGSVDVIVYSNYKWEISGISDWCTPSAKSGDANEDGQKVTFSADAAYDDREATFWFRCADEKIKFVVSQKFKEAIIPDANNTFNIPAEGGVAVISYQTTVDCEVVIPEEAKDWITIAPATRGLVSENINLDIAENTTYSARTAVVKVVAKDNAELAVEYTIYQEQNDAVLANGNTEFNIDGREQQITIKHKANIDCEVIIPEEAQDWITIVPASRGLVSENINLDIAENTTYSSRTAVIKVVAKDNAELVVEYTINQEQNDAILADENNTFTVPSAGGEVVINYQTNIDCDVIIPEEAQDWITIAPATRGLVSENINLNIAENTTYSTRTAVVKVVAKDNAELAVEYTINQEQKNGVLVDGNNTFNVYGAGGSVVIKYQANVDCDVIIPDEAQDWVTIAPATRGLSTYSTTLNIAENNSGKERSCVVNVVSKDNNKLSAEYTIIQNSRYCLYYTSSNGEIVQPNNSSAFGATITSNTYIDGIGVIDFNTPITTIGNSAFEDCSSLTSVTIPDSVTSIGNSAFYDCDSLTSVTIGNSVTTIGNSAFQGCSSLQEFKSKYASEDGRCLIIDGVLNYFAPAGLTEYTIPDSVTTIGNYAFYNCDCLTSVTIPDSVTTIGNYAFCDCDSLTSITIPDSVTTIGERAFSGCSSLTSVTIPDSVTMIGKCAFEYCSRLTSVTIPDSVTTIGGYAFDGCSSLTSVYISDIAAWCNISFSTTYSNPLYYAHNLYLNNELVTDLTIPDSVTAIGDGTFRSCSSLTSVTIGDGVTTIGDGAFGKCYSLTSVTIGDSVTTIGDSAFYDCYSLTSVTIGNSVTTVGDAAFHSCSSLTSVTIGDSVTTIGDKAFWDCYSLTSVNIPDSVTEIGGYAFYFCSNLTSVTIGDSVTSIGYEAFRGCSSLTSVTIGDSVTSIGYEAFRGCSSLTSVTIGDSVTSIGYEAFRGCSSLTSVTIPDSVTSIGDWAFYDCVSLTSVTIGDSVTTIGKSAFSWCKNITSVTIPDSVTTIGDDAFYGCTGELIINSKIVETDYDWSYYPFKNGWLYGSKFTSLTIGNGVTTIGSSAFYGCSSLTSVTIPDSVTTIGDNAFHDCSSLTSVTIPDSVTTIGGGVFYNCSSLTSVTIPDSVTTIGDYVFDGCSSLTSVTIPDSVTTIGDHVFDGCSSLTSVTIPDSVTTIGNGAFEDCSSLTSVTIPDNVTTIGRGAFYGCTGELIIYSKIIETDYYSFDNRPTNGGWLNGAKFTKLTIGDSVTTIGDYAFASCSSLTSVTIPDSVTSIGSYAFSGCSLTSVTIPDSVTSIGSSAFSGCSLTSVTIPDSVTSIGSYAFSGCSSLTSVTIPDSVTTIGWAAFYYCSRLTSVYCKATTPPAVTLDYYYDWCAFDGNASGRKIYVPMESVNNYKSASGWSSYASAIVGYNF